MVAGSVLWITITVAQWLFCVLGVCTGQGPDALCPPIQELGGQRIPLGQQAFFYEQEVDQCRVFFCQNTRFGLGTTATLFDCGTNYTNCSMSYDPFQQQISLCCRICSACDFVSCPNNQQCNSDGNSYRCNCPSDNRQCIDSLLQVFITAEADPTIGQSYTFICNVTAQEGVTGIPTVQWMGPSSSDPIATGGDFTVNTTPPYTLTINPLRQSQDGQYTCQATVGTFTATSSATLRVEVPPVSVVITPVGTPVVGQSYSLTCSVHGTDSLSPTSTTYRWYNESNNPRSLAATTNVYTLIRLQPYHDGNYTCEVSVVSPYLNGVFNWSAMQEIMVQNPPLPTAPTITLGITTPTSVVVSWSQQAPVDSYEISFQRATGNQQLGDCTSFQHNGSISVGGNVTVYNLTGLQEFSTYFIIVTAVNVAGRNGSNPVAVNTQMAAPSGGPEMLREVNITSTSITIAWDAINCVDRNGNIIGYEVHYVPSPSRGTGSVVVARTGNAGNMLTIDGLTPSTCHFIQVAAVNSDGALGQLSTAIIVQTAPEPVATQTLGGGSLPVETLVGAVVGACFGTALLYTAVLLVVKFTLVLCNKRRHRNNGSKKAEHRDIEASTDTLVTANL